MILKIQAPDWIAAIAASSLSRQIGDSLWMFAAIEAVHLLGLALFGGALLAVDLSLLGVGFSPGEVGSLERKARPWLWAGLALIVMSGVLMFIAQPEKCYFNPAFRFKMVALMLGAFVLTTLRRGVFRRLNEHLILVPIGLKTMSVVSLGLWLAVAVAGRAIGFY